MEIDFLTCFMCKVSTIPAPEGATEETRYICAKCSDIPMGITESTPHFDRCAFDTYLASHVPGHTMRTTIGGQNGLLGILESGLERIMAKVPFDVMGARQRGEIWTTHATPENIRALPEKCAQALLLTMWVGMTSDEAGELLDIRAQTVRYNAMRAKKILAGFNGDINSLRNNPGLHAPKKPNKHWQRETVHGKPGRKTGKEIEAKRTLIHAA